MATTTAPQAPAAPQAASAIPGVTAQQTDPTNDLRSKTLSIAPTANRMDLANTYLKNWNDTTAPQFGADLNKATSNAAATGKLGSGGLRTSLGDLTYNRDLQRNAQASNYYTDALQGSIGDAQFNVGQANQQQAYQTGLQNQTFNQGLAQSQFGQQQYNDQFSHDLATTQQANATQNQQFNQGITTAQQQAALQAQQFGQDLSTKEFGSNQQNQTFNQGLASSQLAASLQAQQFGQGITQQQLSDSETNGSFSRALQSYLTGTSGDPSQLYMALSGQAANQANQGQQAVGSLINNSTANNTNNGILQQILSQYMKPSPTAPSPSTLPAGVTDGGYLSSSGGEST